jgi:hypothetical protein
MVPKARIQYTLLGQGGPYVSKVLKTTHGSQHLLRQHIAQYDIRYVVLYRKV